MTAGRIPVFRVDGPAPAGQGMQEEWECADCGWSVTTSQLVAGWTVAGARAAHVDWYCAAPPSWP